jgi:hypothetical protein
VAIEDDDVERDQPRLRECALPVMGDVDGHSLPAKPPRQRRGQGPLVLDEEDANHGSPASPRRRVGAARALQGMGLASGANPDAEPRPRDCVDLLGAARAGQTLLVHELVDGLLEVGLRRLDQCLLQAVDRLPVR